MRCPVVRTSKCQHTLLLELTQDEELRNRIYSHILEQQDIRVLRKHTRTRPKPADHNRGSRLWPSGYGLTHVCRNIWTEFRPLYKAAIIDSILPQDLYEYLEVFLRSPGTSNDEIAGSVIIDFSANVSSILDIKPILLLLHDANNFHVGASDILEPQDFQLSPHLPVPDLRDILTYLYDIVDLDAFYDYLEYAMTMLEVECDDTKGVEIVFELDQDHWEPWMGVWSRPQDDPQSRVGIPLEIADNVVEWGKACGMELNRAEGSHLTVNFRQGLRGPPVTF